MKLLLALLLLSLPTAAQVHGGPANPGPLSCSGPPPMLPNLPPRPEGCDPWIYNSIVQEYIAACLALRDSLCAQMSAFKAELRDCQSDASDGYAYCLQYQQNTEEGCWQSFQSEWNDCDANYYASTQGAWMAGVSALANQYSAAVVACGGN